MIPKKLRFSAFGPFNKEQVIDFSKFQDDRLFLISGKTGSGKTTIFDAISFSLFGKPSGSLRDTDSFKSHFAEDDEICFCEFEFFSKGHNYVIYREPIQMKLKRTGNLVRENAAAKLTTDNKETISGIDAVNRKIEEILGLNADQFKKIVMLPQGEFRKFLSDDSAEKQKILRKIFSTEIIDKFTEKLRENASSMKRQFEDSETMCEAYIANVFAPEGIALKDELEKETLDFNNIIAEIENYSSLLSAEIESINAEIKRLNAEKEKINLPYFKEINKKFDELHSYREKLENLNKKAKEISAVKSDVEKIKSAKEIKPFDEKYRLAASQRDESQKKVQAIQADIEKNNDLIARSSNYFGLWKEKHDNLSLYNEELQALSAKLEAGLELKAETEKLSAILKEKQAAEKEIAEAKLQVEYQKLLENGKNLKDRLLLLREIEEAEKKRNELNEAHIKISAEYQQVFAQFIGSQSYRLSLTLENGAPCPVCGSVSHPSPAKKPSEVVTDETLESKKKELDESYQSCLSQKTALDGLIAKAEITDKSEIEPQKKELEEKLTTARTTMDDDRYRPFFGKEFNIDAILEGLKEKEQNLAVLSERQASADEKIALLRSKIDNPDCDEIQKEIESKKSFIDEVKKNFEEATQYRQKYLNRESELRGMLLQEKNQLKGSEEKYLSAKKEFDSALLANHMNSESFKAQIERADKLPELEKQCADYNADLAATKSLIASYTLQLQGLSPVNTSALQVKFDEIEAKIAEKSKALTSNALILNGNNKAKDSLKKELKKSEEIYQKYTRYNYIYDLAQGKYSGNVNFERYILASYFDDIIDSANLRLEEMSNSRYTLKRRFEKEKGRRSSGLELEVMDAYSGTNRHVNTLSGGESFMVSLSLALGLADIMSEASGGVEVDTMFIDEGFGSLDSDSLSAAIECLTKIKETGRYIGIISHVSELKEKIPSKISVMQSNVGSYIEQE